MLQAAQFLQLTVVAMLGLALVMVRSADMAVGAKAPPFDPMRFLFSRQTAYATLAIGAMLLASRLPWRRVVTWRPRFNPFNWAILVAIALLLAQWIPFLGHEVNGALRWIQIEVGGRKFTFQPSELAKWAMVLWIPWWVATQTRRIDRLFSRGFFVPLVVLLGVVGVIIGEDLGTAVLIFSVGVGLLLAAGARFWHLALLIPPGVMGVAAVIMSSDYRRARLTAFLDPWADPEGIGYHPIQSMLAIAQGGPTGRGVGNGVQKFGYLPEDTTDFLFSIICEEMGIVGAVLVVSFYLVVLVVGFGILRRCPDAFGRLVALGILLMLGAQALMNLAVVTVVVPTKGIALPLLSSGGTGWVMTAAAIGVLASLDETDPALREDDGVLSGEPLPSEGLAIEGGT